MQCYGCPFLYKEMFSYARCLILNKEIYNLEHDKCYVDNDQIIKMIEMLKNEIVKRNIKKTDK